MKKYDLKKLKTTGEIVEVDRDANYPYSWVSVRHQDDNISSIYYTDLLDPFEKVDKLIQKSLRNEKTLSKNILEEFKRSDIEAQVLKNNISFKGSYLYKNIRVFEVGIANRPKESFFMYNEINNDTPRVLASKEACQSEINDYIKSKPYEKYLQDLKTSIENSQNIAEFEIEKKMASFMEDYLGKIQ